MEAEGEGCGRTCKWDPMSWKETKWKFETLKVTEGENLSRHTVVLVSTHSTLVPLAMDTPQKNPVTYLYFIPYIISVLIESHF